MCLDDLAIDALKRKNELAKSLQHFIQALLPDASDFCKKYVSKKYNFPAEKRNEIANAALVMTINNFTERLNSKLIIYSPRDSNFTSWLHTVLCYSIEDIVRQENERMNLESPLDEATNEAQINYDEI